MPEKRTVKRARRKACTGKAPTTQAGEFVREEIRHVREGKHGARSPQQAIAIGLSKARRASVKLGPPPPGSQAARKARHCSASRQALARQTHRAAERRGRSSRRRAAVRAVRTTGRAGRRRAAQKAARARWG